MLKLNLPPFDINVKKVNGRTSVFDLIRRKFVALTPEEWVRQHFVNFLLTAALIQIFLAHFRFHVILKSDLNDLFFQ